MNRYNYNIIFYQDYNNLSILGENATAITFSKNNALYYFHVVYYMYLEDGKSFDEKFGSSSQRNYPMTLTYKLPSPFC